MLNQIRNTYSVRSFFLFLGVAALMLVPMANAQAQIDWSNMSMKIGMDKETDQFISDIMNWRVAVSPIHVAIKNITKTITFELHNPTKDTLKLTFHLSDTLVGANRFIYKDSSLELPKKKTSAKVSLGDTSDSVSYNPKPLSGWIKEVPKPMSILPGERKSVSITIDIPEGSLSEEYLTWIVAEVLPRKMVPEVNKAVYTTSSVKVTYKSESNNSEGKKGK